MKKMTRYGVTFYDKNKRELTGSDGFYRPDGRKSTKTIILECDEKIHRQRVAYKKNPKKYVKPNAEYLRIFKGGLLHPSYVTDFILIK